MNPLTRYRVVLELDIATGQEDESGVRLGPEQWIWDRILDLHVAGERIESVEVYKHTGWERLK